MAGARAGLRDALASLPTDPEPYKSLAGLWLEQGRVDRVVDLMEQARAAGLDEGWRLRILVAAARVQAGSGSTAQMPDWAADSARELLRRHPASVRDHLRVADLYWALGRPGDAGRIYARCLELSDRARLDPVRQLSAEQLRLVRDRLEKAGGPPAGG